MPRPIFGAPRQERRSEELQGAGLRTRPLRQAVHSQTGMSPAEQDRLLRRPRSKAYMDAIHSLDNGGHVQNRSRTEELVQAIREEFPEVELSGVFLGVVSKCYLGTPYEVHSLDMTGSIIEHYKRGETMSGGLEKARSLAMCGSYDFVEVYIDCCRAVSANGAVSVVKG